MKHSNALSLGFKGERTYIHGTDMLNATMQSVSSHIPHARIEKLDFKISAMTNQMLTCHWWPRSTPEALEGKVSASFTIQLDGIEYEGKLIQAEAYAETRRAYDELPILNQCVYTSADRSVTLRDMPENFTQIEVLVSMNKALLLEELSIPSSSQWVFCRWESSTWPLSENLSGVQLTLEQTLGTRLTRSSVKLNAEQIGTIYFSALDVG
jgi:hypothetical protein